MQRGTQKLHHELTKKGKLPKSEIEPSTASIGGRFELGVPMLAIRARATIPAGYLRTQKFKQYTTVIQESVTQKSTRGSLCSHLRASPAQKQKSYIRDTSGIEHTYSLVSMRTARACLLYQSRLADWPHICGHSTNPVNKYFLVFAKKFVHT